MSNCRLSLLHYFLFKVCLALKLARKLKEELRRKYSRIKFLLSELNTRIDSLEDETQFFDVLSTLKIGIEEIQFLKKEIKITPDPENVVKFEDEFDIFAKQIKSKFDNIIRTKKLELAEVQRKLVNLQNSKKLINYYKD